MNKTFRCTVIGSMNNGSCLVYLILCFYVQINIILFFIIRPVWNGINTIQMSCFQSNFSTYLQNILMNMIFFQWLVNENIRFLFQEDKENGEAEKEKTDETTADANEIFSTGDSLPEPEPMEA